MWLLRYVSEQTDRQTDRQTYRQIHRKADCNIYFAPLTPPEGEVNINYTILMLLFIGSSKVVLFSL